VIRLLPSVLTTALLVNTALAQSLPPDAIKLGMGGKSCAFWLQSLRNEEAGRGWVAAYWILRWKDNPKPSPLMHTLMLEIQKRCEADASKLLGEVTENYLAEFETAHPSGLQP
jgi:hypothetical protein